jgi:hypothetical protein
LAVGFTDHRQIRPERDRGTGADRSRIIRIRSRCPDP